MLEWATAITGFALTLLLHASVLLGAVWLLERLGALKHAAWAEAAWRGALFGALLTASVATLREPASVAPAPADPAPTASTRAGSLGPTAGAPAAVAAREGTDTAHSLQADTAPVTRAPTAHHADASVATGAAAAAPGAAIISLAREAVVLIAQAWLALTLSWLLLTLWRTQRVLKMARAARARPAADGSLRAQGEHVARALGVVPPALHIDAALASPIALPGRVLLLPRWSTTLPEAEARALLAHEVAHLLRRDPAWRIAQHLALAPMTLHPLAWLALRRLDQLAERRADAHAARLLGDGRPLAECLARCLAQHLAHPATPRFALAMAEPTGAVVDRVQRLLEEDPMDTRMPSPRRTRLTIGLALAAALFLPTVVVGAFADSLLQGQSISVHSDGEGNESVSLEIKQGLDRLALEMEGKLVFAEDESDVISMAADAEFELEETRDGVTRSLVLEPADRGLARDYRVEGKAHDFDADARAWLARVLPEVFRSSGIDAQARATRILARGGADALLAEIGHIRTDFGRATYLAQLYAQAKPDAAQLARALELTAALESDYEKRKVLSLALSSPQLARAPQLQLLTLAGTIDSDYELAELLIQTAATFTLDEAALAAWSAALDAVDSDYETRRVLTALLERPQQGAAAVRLALEAARGLDSDYEKRQLMASALASAGDDAALRTRYVDIAATLDSDFERKQALLLLLSGGPVDRALALATLEAIDGIGSDFECKEALVALARVMPADAAVLERYRASARRLGTHERGEAEQALDRIAQVY